MAFLRCGSVRFSKIVKATVRFGVFKYPTVRFGAFFRNQESYGAVRLGFEEGKNPRAVRGSGQTSRNFLDVLTRPDPTRENLKAPDPTQPDPTRPARDLTAS